MAALAPVAIAAAAIGSVVEGDAQRDAAYASAGVDEENARLAILSGEQDAFALARDERFRVGEAIAGQGGNGLLSTGSIQTLIEASAFERELEIANRRMEAFRDAENYSTRAANSRQAGDNAFIGGLFGAVSGAIEGAANIRQQRKVEKANARRRRAQSGTNFTRYGG